MLTNSTKEQFRKAAGDVSSNGVKNTVANKQLHFQGKLCKKSLMTDWSVNGLSRAAPSPVEKRSVPQTRVFIVHFDRLDAN